jgi:tetratricopeptide (TPR) repeat protein
MWFFLTLAPESSFAPLAEVVNDHRPYIASSLGLSVLLAWIVERAAMFAGKQRRAVFVGAVALLCTGAIVVGFRRSGDWTSEQKIWESTVRASPNNGRAWMNAGRIHLKNNNFREARRYFERSKELMPTYPYLYMNLSALELAENNPKEAIRWANESIRFGANLSRSHFALGRALEQQGRYGEAALSYGKASELDPNDTQAREAFERTRAAQQQADSRTSEDAMMAEGLRLLDTEHDANRAVQQFRAVLARNPSHYGATWQLARALDAAGKADEARTVWQQMLGMTIRAKDMAGEARVRERLGQGASK